MERLTYDDPQLRATLTIERPEPGVFVIYLNGNQIGQMCGFDAWLYRNWALGYPQVWVKPGDVEFFQLDAARV